jgi:hypothetical protein
MRNNSKTHLSVHNPYIQALVWNLFPLVGVWFLNWNPFSVLLCYLLESGVIGVFNTFKVTAVTFYGKVPEPVLGVNSVGLFSIPIFIIAFSMLLALNFYGFFHVIGLPITQKTNMLDVIHVIISQREMQLLLTTFFVLNAFSFITEFILPEKYQELTIEQQVVLPFPRVIIVQVLIFIGGLLYVNTGARISMLIVLMALKTIAEWVYIRYKVEDFFTS